MARKEWTPSTRTDAERRKERTIQKQGKPKHPNALANLAKGNGFDVNPQNRKDTSGMRVPSVKYFRQSVREFLESSDADGRKRVEMLLEECYRAILDSKNEHTKLRGTELFAILSDGRPDRPVRTANGPSNPAIAAGVMILPNAAPLQVQDVDVLPEADASAEPSDGTQADTGDQECTGDQGDTPIDGGGSTGTSIE